MKILIIGLIIAALFQISLKLAHAGYYEFKPVKQEAWMNRGYMFKNFKYCKGKFYRKHVKCEWVKKVKK